MNPVLVWIMIIRDNNIEEYIHMHITHVSQLSPSINHNCTPKRSPEKEFVPSVYSF